MKKTVKFTLLLMCSLLIFVSNVTAKQYTDLNQDHWAYNQIQKLTNLGILVGYPDGSFHPDELITRAEFATLAVYSLGLKNYKIKEVINFSDIDEDFWGWPNIQKAVTLGLVKGHTNSTFAPNDTITRAQAYSVAMSALGKKSMSDEQVQAILGSRFEDAKQIPVWVCPSVARAVELKMIVNIPSADKKFNASDAPTRAELSALVLSMLEQAKLNPNEKIKQAIEPKKGKGITISSAQLEGYIATIPAGTVLPVCVVDKNLSSQTTKEGEAFSAKTPRNYVTKENYILIVEGSPVAGRVLSVKIGRYFIRDGKMILATQTIQSPNNKVFPFEGQNYNEKVKIGFWKQLFRTIFKGAKVKYDNGQIMQIELLKPVKIDLTTGTIID